MGAPHKFWGMGPALRTRLKERFDMEGIETSSPQRTMWVHDGDTSSVSDGGADGRAESPSISEGDEHP